MQRRHLISRALWTPFLTTVGLNAAFADEAKERSPKNATATADSEPQWNLLNDWRDRHITRIEISLDKRSNKDSILRKSFKMVVANPDSLKRFEIGQFDSFLRPAVDVNSIEGGVGIGANLGLIRIWTTLDKFSIRVTAEGFSLEADHADVRRIFFSYLWAHLVDDIHFKETGFHLPHKLLASLSGETAIENQKSRYFGFVEDNHSHPEPK